MTVSDAFDASPHQISANTCYTLPPDNCRISTSGSQQVNDTTIIMDRQSAYALSVYGPETDDNGNVLQESRSQIEKQLMNFILDFQLDGIFIYR